jgi:hypothetical protein
MKRVSWLLLLFAFVGGSQAFGDPVVYNEPAGQGTQNFYGNLANFFTVNSSVTVVSLGVFNASGTGYIAGPIQVGLYDVTAGIQVGPTVTFQGQYTPQGLGYDVFQSITPVTLVAGDLYEVDAVGFSVADPNGNLNTGSSSGPALNNLGGALSFPLGYSVYSFSTTLDFPTATTNGGVLDRGGPNDQYVPALYDAGTFAVSPEPSSLFLFGSGLLGLAGALRHKFCRKLHV